MSDYINANFQVSIMDAIMGGTNMADSNIKPNDTSGIDPNIKWPRWRCNLDMTVAKGFRDFALDTDEINPGMIIDGEQLTLGWLRLLHGKYPTHVFPQGWSEGRKMAFLIKAELQNEVVNTENIPYFSEQDLRIVTTQDIKIAKYWFDKKRRLNAPNLQTKCGSFDVFGQYFRLRGLAFNEYSSPATLSQARKQFVVKIASDPSMIECVVANILRAENLAEAQIQAEAEEAANAAANAWKAEFGDVDELIAASHGAGGRYDGDGNFIMDEVDTDGETEEEEEEEEEEEDQEYDGTEDYYGTREEKLAYLAADRAKEAAEAAEAANATKKTGSESAMRAMDIDEDYDGDFAIEEEMSENALSYTFGPEALSATEVQLAADAMKDAMKEEAMKNADKAEVKKLTNDEEERLCAELASLGIVLEPLYMYDLKDALPSVELAGTKRTAEDAALESSQSTRDIKSRKIAVPKSQLAAATPSTPSTPSILPTPSVSIAPSAPSVPSVSSTKPKRKRKHRKAIMKRNKRARAAAAAAAESGKMDTVDKEEVEDGDEEEVEDDDMEL